MFKLLIFFLVIFVRYLHVFLRVLFFFFYPFVITEYLKSDALKRTKSDNVKTRKNILQT